MATENKRMKQRMDTLANWTSNNPSVEPGEICLIQGSTDYRINNSSTATNFLNCQLYKGSDTTTSAAGNGTITVELGQSNPAFQTIDSFTVNQSANKTISLPNFVADAKLNYPTGDVKALVQSDWVAGRSLSKKLPHCIPTDLVICIFREWAALLQTNGTQRAMEDAQTAIISALGLSNLEIS